MCTAVLIGWEPETLPPPPKRIWALLVIKIDDISLWPPDQNHKGEDGLKANADGNRLRKSPNDSKSINVWQSVTFTLHKSLSNSVIVIV